MPTQLPTGCVLGAAFHRADSRDCVVMSAAARARGWERLGDLPAGSVVGTSSLRRAAQVRRLFPGLVVKDVRGNVGTRLKKLDDEEGWGFQCLILAAAGLLRIGEGRRLSCYLGRKNDGWLGAVGQGALGVEVREGDGRVRGLVEGLMGLEGGWDDDDCGEGRMVWLACLAERSLLRTLEGGCSVPIGVETEWVGMPDSTGKTTGLCRAFFFFF